MHIKPLLLAATSLGLMLPFTPVFAQNALAAGGSVDESEIIVTARKRQESVLKVPVTETVLGSVQIARQNIKDLFDVQKQTVGLKLGIASVETGAQISIRGFGTNATDPGVDQSVSLNLDGLQLTEGLTYTVGTFDMQQIEVLKGPQALFFGKASPAGVVSIRTNDPGDHVELIARTGYEFNAHEWRNELIVSGPLTPTLGVRFATLYDHFGGYFFNKATPNLASGALPMPHRFGEDNSFFARSTVVWKPTPEFSARLKVNYTRDRQKGSTAGQYIHCPEGAVTFLPSIGINFVPEQFATGEQCKADREVAIVGMNPTAFPGEVTNPSGITPLDGGHPASNISQKFGSLELNYTPLPAVTLTSVTGYFKLNVGVDHNCYFSGAGAPACLTEKRLTRRDFTEELRATTDFSGPLNFTIGGFYQNGKIRDDETLPGNINYFLPPLIFDGNMTIHIKSTSVFGQARYKVLPQLELAGGARYTDEKRRLDSVTYDEPFNPFHPGGVLSPGTPEYLTNPRLHSKNWSPEATITWTPTNDLTVFGSWKRAYKSGSYNIITPTNPAGPVALVNGRYVGTGVNRSYGDEKIQGFEIGIKSRLFDRQLNFNITGYDYKASDLQVGTIEPAAGGLPVLNTLNAATARIYGIESDLHYRPEQVPGLELTGAVNWNHAKFTSFPNAPCLGGDTFAEGCNRFPAPVTTQTNDAFTTGRPATATTPAIPANLPPGVTAADLPMALQNGTPFRYTAEDLSGYPLVRAPRWTANIGAHYEMPVGRDMKLGIGGDGQYSSKYLVLLGLGKVRPWYYQTGYWKFNTNVTLTGPDDLWELSFVGNNLTNKLIVNGESSTSAAGALFFGPTITGGPTHGLAGIDEADGFVDRGRELWIRLTVKLSK